ncbi:MAG: bacteriocin [Marinifilaceae bacterium]|jgi:bacteriocin-like protein|nr:bacteriocin [Marinifilaceae bacterium]
MNTFEELNDEELFGIVGGANNNPTNPEEKEKEDKEEKEEREYSDDPIEEDILFD